MANRLTDIDILSGAQSQALRTFCTHNTFGASDLDAYARLLQNAPLTIIEADFKQRISITSLDSARQSLADLQYGPTKVPLFNYLLQLVYMNPSDRARYISIVRYLALEAKVPVDTTDLSGTTAFMYSISTKPYWDKDFADIMVEAGTEINKKNRYGCVAGHDIVLAQDFSPAGKKKTCDAFKYFLDNGGNLDIADGDGITARRIAGTIARTMIPEMRQLLNGGEETPAVAQKTPRGAKVGRNEPCSCGSKKKYKICCGKI